VIFLRQRTVIFLRQRTVIFLRPAHHDLPALGAVMATVAQEDRVAATSS
jgi:hypothetical protein